MSWLVGVANIFTSVIENLEPRRYRRPSEVDIVLDIIHLAGELYHDIPLLQHRVQPRSAPQEEVPSIENHEVAAQEEVLPVENHEGAAQPQLAEQDEAFAGRLAQEEEGGSQEALFANLPARAANRRPVEIITVEDEASEAALQRGFMAAFSSHLSGAKTALLENKIYNNSSIDSNEAFQTIFALALLRLIEQSPKTEDEYLVAKDVKIQKDASGFLGQFFTLCHDFELLSAQEKEQLEALICHKNQASSDGVKKVAQDIRQLSNILQREISHYSQDAAIKNAFLSVFS